MCKLLVYSTQSSAFKTKIAVLTVFSSKLGHLGYPASNISLAPIYLTTQDDSARVVNSLTPISLLLIPVDLAVF